MSVGYGSFETALMDDDAASLDFVEQFQRGDATKEIKTWLSREHRKMMDRGSGEDLSRVAKAAGAIADVIDIQREHATRQQSIPPADPLPFASAYRPVRPPTGQPEVDHDALLSGAKRHAARTEAVINETVRLHDEMERMLSSLLEAGKV